MSHNIKKIKRRCDICSSCENYINVSMDLKSLKGKPVRGKIIYCKNEIFKEEKKKVYFENEINFFTSDIAENCLRKFEYWILSQGDKKQDENTAFIGFA